MRKNIRKTLVSLSLIASLVVTGVSVNQSAKTTAQAAKKTVVKISKTSVKVKHGKTQTLKITVKNGKLKSKSFSSSDKSVATVTNKGVVKGVLEGKATVKCVVKYTETGKKKVKSKTFKCKVTVYDTLYPVKAVEKEEAYKTSSETDGISHGSKEVVTGFANKDNVTLQMKYNDKSNISDKAVSFTPKGGTKKITKKDNGSMRRDLSAQYLQQYEMGTGINLGNTEEAVYGVGSKLDVIAGTDETAYDKAWGQPEITEKYFEKLHSYGINTLRIPVAWSNADIDDGTYTIKDEYLGRVEEIVNYALNNGMYVVINDHWDNQWWGQFGACKYQEIVDEDGDLVKEYVTEKNADGEDVPVPDEELRAKAWARYEAYWTQIAERFKGYSDHLIFEGANEELGDRLIDAIGKSGYAVGNDSTEQALAGYMTEDELYETVNKINQKFVDIIRNSGGNNKNRHLLIPGYNTDITKTVDKVQKVKDENGVTKEVGNRYVMPTDIEENGTSKLFLSVHYYTPWDFCGDGGTGTYTVADQENTAKYFQTLKKFTDQGYGVIVGEFGVCNPLQDGVTKWLQDTMEIAAKNGCIPLLWDTPGTYFDREACVMQFKDVAEMYNSITGASGDTNINSNTGFVKADVNYYTTLPESAKQVFQWKGEWKKNDGSNIGLDGNLVTSSGIEQFIKTESVSENEQITFNDWGYQSFLKLDWSKYKNPVVYSKKILQMQ